jgi:hypothetical protein
MDEQAGTPGPTLWVELRLAKRLVDFELLKLESVRPDPK